MSKSNTKRAQSAARSRVGYMTHEPKSLFSNFGGSTANLSSAQLNLTTHAKALKYQTNHGGRDSYIHNNNGGFTAGHTVY